MLLRALLVLSVLCTCTVTAHARQWTDATGRFKIDAEFFSANDATVVIKRKNGSLVAIELAQLSEDDQAFVAEQRKKLDAEKATGSQALEQMQTWTSRDGFEIRGRVVAFGRRDIVVRRMAGVVEVNGTAFSRLNSFYQYIIPKIVAEYADSSVKTAQDVDRWLRAQKGVPAPITVEGVLLKLEDGSELAVPFFLFSENDLAVLSPGWHQWSQSAASKEEKAREDYLMNVQAESYQRERQAAVESHQIQQMQLGLLAVNAGLVSIWEVILRPTSGAYGRQVSVVVPAQNSLQAEQMAMQQYPGFAIVGVRRASN